MKIYSNGKENANGNSNLNKDLRADLFINSNNSFIQNTSAKKPQENPGNHESEEIKKELERREALKHRSTLTNDEINLIAIRRIWTANWNNHDDWKTYGCSDCANSNGRANRRINEHEVQENDIPVKIKLKSKSQILSEIKEEFKKKKIEEEKKLQETKLEEVVKEEEKSKPKPKPKRKRKPVLKKKKEIKKEDTPKIDETTSKTKEEPKPVIKNITLNVPFVARRTRFKGDPSSQLNIILKILQMDPRNKVRLSPNTGFGKGVDFYDLWGFMGDVDTSDQLVVGRAITIKKWFSKRGIKSDQLVFDVSDSFNKKPNVTGTMIIYK